MKWDDSDATYPNAVVVDKADVSHALTEWWERLMAHAETVSDWDTVVADCWVETGRIIGHVQRDDQAVGMDRGMRVCLRVAPIADELHAASFDEECHFKCSRELGDWADASRRVPRVNEWLREKGAQVWLCQDGQLMAAVKPL